MIIFYNNNKNNSYTTVYDAHMMMMMLTTCQSHRESSSSESRTVPSSYWALDLAHQVHYTYHPHLLLLIGCACLPLSARPSTSYLAEGLLRLTDGDL